METIWYRTEELRKRLAQTLQQEALEFTQTHHRKPCLAVVLVGDNPASHVYVASKTKACLDAGLDVLDFKLPATASFQEISSTVETLNKNKVVDGILVQSPLPKGIDEKEIFKKISPEKDVDGFHPVNIGALVMNPKKTIAEGLVPCTPAGILEILKDINFSLNGKNVVVVGRSNIVGRPISIMLSALDATVTVCHSKTNNLAHHTSQADLLVLACGIPNFINDTHIKTGAIVIDVGVNRLENKKIVGDGDSNKLKGKAQLLTAVPGGVGPMTITMLIQNTIRAAKQREQGK
ncbi:MAG: bifunctional 5,10-methylenetetrahydrofolate dehydrogenase/5,10-methenyltetrahydrofolate cyclohydrolase [Oligoflexia bacterium]|nr:bifunctional 5,10-methylenetetrahydrofolate dehydrogenase/5,10-methenyltetrahydrofolate cyclohydrolase [Oligoflexia bacterium]